MTDNHEHTPTTDLVSSVYVQYMTRHGDTSMKRIDDGFDRWLATVEAAAEQRGAERAIAVFEEMSDDMGEAIAFDVLTTPHGEAEYPVSHFREKLQEAINDATDQTRADQEGDDE